MARSSSQLPPLGNAWRRRRLAVFLPLLLVALSLVPVGRAAAVDAPTVTIGLTPPSVIRVGEAVTLTAEVRDPYQPQPGLHRAYFCLADAEFCDFGSPGAIAIVFGATVEPNVGRWTASTTGFIDPNAQHVEREFTPGTYEVRAWYFYSPPDEPGVFYPVPSTATVQFMVLGAEAEAPVVTTAALPDGTVGEPYTAPLTATGVPAPSWQATGLPEGLAANPGSGVISGTPTTAGAYPVQVTASNGVPPDGTANLPLTVRDARTAPTITSGPLPGGTVGARYTATLAATGRPAPAWQATGLPDGLTLDPATGSIAGTPTAAGSFPVRVTASNGVPPDAVQDHTLVIERARAVPAITSGPPPAGTTGVRYEFVLTAGGFPEPKLAVTGLPPGLTFDQSKRLIRGIPRVPGSSTVQVEAVNGVPPSTVRRYTLVIVPGPTFPAAALSPDPLDFGEQQVGTEGTVRTVTMTNTGTSALLITALSVADEATFHLPRVPGVDQCSGRVVTPGGTCTVGLVFRPSVTGQLTGTLAVAGEVRTPNSRQELLAEAGWEVSLAGRGTAPGTGSPVATFTPSSVDFGEQPVGTVSPFRTVTLTNTGSAPLQITSSSMEPPFAPRIRTDPAPGECDLVALGDRRSGLPPGRSCTLRMAFGPDVAGSFTGAFVLTGSGGNVIRETWRLPLSGRTPPRGAPEVTFSVASVDFGDQRVGDTSIRRVTLTNTGTAELRLDPVAAERPFDARDGGPPTGCVAKEPSRPSGLPVGRSCTVDVTFRPAGLGQAEGVLLVRGSGGDLVAGTWELPLTGTGVHLIG